jgi:uncharacterized protein (TIGR02145 family)
LNNLTPTANGSVVSGGMTLNVSTNNPTGYHLTMKSNSLNMVNTVNNAYSLSPVSGSIAVPNALSNNTWGFAIPKTQTNASGLISSGFDNTYAIEDNNQNSESHWAAVPVTDTTIKSTSSSTQNDATSIFFGAKGTTELASSAYTAEIVFTTLANDVPSPAISSISPDSGSQAGGNTVVITGANFYDQETVVKVAIGDVDCISYTVIDSTSLTCVVPASTSGAGAKDVSVTTISGGTVTKTDGFTYNSPAPIVTSISPDSGHFIGGETFTITGSGFTDITAVNLGGSACHSYTIDSDTQITCMSSGYDLGGSASATVSVNVTNAYGTSAANTLFIYRYLARSYTNGQANLDVLGTDIALGSKIYVDGAICTNSKITSATTAACNTPSLGSGARNVTIAAPVAAYKFANAGAYNDVGLSVFTCSAIPSTPAYTTTDWSLYTVIVKDTRNNQDYRVRKMPDGKCWMIDNLKLANATLTSADSNVTANFTIPANPMNKSADHGNGVCVGGTASGTGAYLTCDGTSTQSAANTPYIAWTDPSSADNSYSDNCTDQNGVSSDSLTGCGYLYNWYTATAGSGSYANTSGDMAQSICPAGWRLPSAGTGTANEFSVLNGAMLNGGSPSTANTAATRPNWRDKGPFEGSTAGYYYSGFINTGHYGYYWSSSAASTTTVLILNFNYSTLYPGNNAYGKNYGLSVRCVL